MYVLSLDNVHFVIMTFWQMPLSKATYIFLIYTTEHLLKSLEVATWYHWVSLSISLELKTFQSVILTTELSTPACPDWACFPCIFCYSCCFDH